MYLFNGWAIDLLQEPNDQGLLASSWRAIEEQVWAVP